MRTPVLLIAGAAIAFGIYKGLQPSPVSVETAYVVRGPIEQTIDEDGITQVREVYAVHAPVSGQLTRVPVRRGSSVVKGETVVATIVPHTAQFNDVRTVRSIEAEIAAAQGEVEVARLDAERARANHALALSELRRVEKLARSELIPARDEERARTAADSQNILVETATRTIEIKQKQLERVRAQLVEPAPHSAVSPSRYEISSPLSGVVIELHRQSAQSVTEGALLMEVADPADLEIAVDLLTQDATLVKPGTQAKISNWGGEPEFDAVVRRVEPAAFTTVSSLGIDEQRVTVLLDPQQTPPELGHGYQVVVSVIISKKTDSLKVPTNALFRHSGNWSVFLLSTDTVQIAQVKIGMTTDSEVEIIDGLNEGDEVVQHPTDRLTDGTVVTRLNAKNQETTSSAHQASN